MLPFFVEFINLLLSSLLVGVMFCVWLVFNPARLDAAHYVMLQQQGIRTLQPTMPRLGVLTLLITIASTVVARENRMRMSLLIAATISFVISGLITRFGNMPINAVVIGWNSAAPPDVWTGLRDAWWRWHCLRLASGLAGMGLVIAATLTRKTSETNSVASLCEPVMQSVLRIVSLLI